MRNAAKLFAAAVLFALPAVAADKKEAPKPPSLDGVWDGWVVEGKGENPNRGQIHLQLTIKDNKVSGKKIGGGGPGGDDMGAGTVVLNAEGEVKQLDATRTGNNAAGGGGGGNAGRGGRRGGPGGAGGGPGGGGGGAGGGYKGILTLEGDTLKWCVANPGKERPTQFATDRRQGQFLLILKKQEPAAEKK